MCFAFYSYCRPGFDIIFADPPYDMEGIEKIPRLAFERDLLVAGGWLILEHPANKHFNEHPAFLEERKYGRVHFTIFEKSEIT
jgi:16S rRNA (guanine966-N2)-methyltransferase